MQGKGLLVERHSDTPDKKITEDDGDLYLVPILLLFLFVEQKNILLVLRLFLVYQDRYYLCFKEEEDELLKMTGITE